MKIAKLALRVGSLTLVSRIFGYFRDISIAFFLGASVFNDAFILALRLPNVFRTIFGEGAFSNTFIPIFSRKLSKGKPDESINFAANVQILLLICVTIFSIIVMLFMKNIVQLIAPGYVGDNSTLELATNLSLISFPYIIFISMMAFYGGISNALGSYFPMASAPIILNLLLIGFIFIGNSQIQKCYWLTASLPIAGIFEMLWVMYFVFKKIGPLKLVWPKLDLDSKILLKRLVPGIIGSGLSQINILVSTIIATYVDGGVSYLYYADRVYQLPLALIGTALGTVILPVLTRKHSASSISKFKVVQNQAILFSMYLIIPTSALIVFKADQIVEILFQHGAFSELATKQTSLALTVFAFGLPMYCFIKIFSSSFYAIGDTKTPVKVTALSLIVNIFFSLLFLNSYQHVAVAIGSVISSFCTVIIMGYILYMEKLFIFYKQILAKILKLIFVTFVMLISIILLEITINIDSKIVELVLSLMVAGVTYISFTNILGIYSFKKLFKK